LTFAVRAPDAVTIRWACAGPTAGTVALTSTRSRTGAGQPSSAASRAQAHQARASASSYSTNGQNSPQPAGPSTSASSRVVIPRKRVRRGSATTDGVPITHLP
jgi:hypothetical protein